MGEKYPLHDFLLATKILKHNRANEIVTFRTLLDELFPRNGRDIERNLDMLIDIGMVYRVPEKIPPKKGYTLTYYVSDTDLSLVDHLEKKLRTMFPEEYSDAELGRTPSQNTIAK
jgi:predicted transcriptional regulator